MSWTTYIDRLMETKDLGDAAIVGFQSPPSVYASHADGNFSKITPEQIQVFVAKDRSGITTNGVMLGLKKYTVCQDRLDHEDCIVLTAKGKPPNRAIICRTKTVLVVGRAAMKILREARSAR